MAFTSFPIPTRTLTLPSGDTVGTTDTQTLTNKTLTSPIINGTVTGTGIPSLFNATGSAPLYSCRAWVNFNGTGTVSIRASGNVSSITDLGTGSYRVNFTFSMQDSLYAVTCLTSGETSSPMNIVSNTFSAAVDIETRRIDGTSIDRATVHVILVR